MQAARGVATAARLTVPRALLVVLMFVAVATIIGGRPTVVGTDTPRYVEHYLEVESCACMVGRFEPAFQMIALSVGVMHLSEGAYLIVLSLAGLLFAAGVAWFAGRLAERSGLRSLETATIVLAFFFISPFFVSAQINAVRHGYSALILFVGVLAWMTGRRGWGVVLSLLSIGFHLSAILSLLSLSMSFLRYRVVLALTLLGSLLYALGATQEIVAHVSDSLGLGIYDMIMSFEIAVDFQADERMDFLAFSLGCGLLVWLTIEYFVPSERRPNLRSLLKTYCLLLMPFLALGWANFSNRYAYSAWMFLPLLVGVTVSAVLPLRLAFGMRAAIVSVAAGALVLMARAGLML